MISRLIRYLRDVKDGQRMSVALSRAACTMPARRIDLTQPTTWEFAGFSQNGEDGILDVLRTQLRSSNRYFVEVGAADGLENNSTWLVVTAQYSGLMIEGDPRLVERARRMVVNYSCGAECHHIFVSLETVPAIKSLALHHDPDILSLDIDGNDYYIARALLDAGFRPKVIVVEYNSVFGPDRSITIQYDARFARTGLYYGVSISGWRRFFDERGYQFVSVERNGVNAFFVDPAYFDQHFLRDLRPLTFAENQYHLKESRQSWEGQFRTIADQSFVTI